MAQMANTTDSERRPTSDDSYEAILPQLIQGLQRWERRPTSDDSYEAILHYTRSHGSWFDMLIEVAKKEYDVAPKIRRHWIRRDITEVIDRMPANHLYMVLDNAKMLSKLGVVLNDKQLARIESELTAERLRRDNVNYMAKLLLIGESKRNMAKVAEQWLRRSLSESGDYYIVLSNSKSIYKKLGVPVKTIFAIIDDESIVPRDRARQAGMYFLDSFFEGKKPRFSRELANDMIDILITMKKATYPWTGPKRTYDGRKGEQVLQTTKAVRKYDIVVCRNGLAGRYQDADALWILRGFPSDVVIKRCNELREAGFVVDVQGAVARMLEDCNRYSGLVLVEKLLGDGVIAWDAEQKKLIFP